VDTLINLQGWKKSPPLLLKQQSTFFRFEHMICLLPTSIATINLASGFTCYATINHLASGYFHHATTLYSPVDTFFFLSSTHFAHCKGVLSPSFHAGLTSSLWAHYQ
jgi:hypothetical protein